MEVEVVLIGALVFVVSAVLIYLISAFTMKEKTFEEVIAEQKRQQEEELLKAKQEKKSDKEHLRKRRKPKEKGKGDQSPKVEVAEPEKIEAKDHKMVEIELEPEIIEPVEAEKPLKMSKKNKPAKPILHNKGEKGPIVPDENVEEFVHRGPTPRDDVELKQIHDKKQKKKEKKQEQQAPAVEEVIQVAESKVQFAAAPSSGKDSNAKLIASLKSASLADSEAQSMIDILLTKYGGSPVAASSDWNKKSQKGDPVALLRKQLEEKERSLQEEQQMVMAANTKMKEMRQELNQEKIRCQSLEKTYKEKVEYQARESQALQSRLQHTHDQHMLEANQMRAAIQKYESQAGDQNTVQRLVEENAALRENLKKTQSESLSATDANNLKQQVSIMEKELSNNARKLNSSENTKNQLEQKLAKTEAELKKHESQQSNASTVLDKRVSEVSEELRKYEAKNSTLAKDLQAKEQAVETAQKECMYLKSKLQELEHSLISSDQSTKEMEEKLKAADRQKLDTEGNLKNLQKKIESLEQEKSSLNNEIQGLKQENTSVKGELQTTQEKLQTETSSKQPNGDIHETDNMITLEEHEKQLNVKVSEIGKLSKEMESRKTELSDLQAQLDKQKQKNNEEVSAGRSEVETFDKAVMERLFPDISVNKKTHKDWMTDFEKQVTNHLQSLKQTPASSDNSAKYDARISDLESSTSALESRLREAESRRDSLQSSLAESEGACSKLQGQVAQYRNVLGETENKLTQLENSVEAEEKKWQERLTAKEGELQKARDEISDVRDSMKAAAGSQEMKGRLEELESELKSSNDRCSQLESQLKQSETKVTEYNEKVIELQKSSATLTEVNTEVEKLRTDLTAEAKKNKDLASQIVKLNGIIKTGHDALTQEQNLVKKLQEQASNGSNKQNSTSVPNSQSSEVEQLRASLAEKEKQLEKELSSNKLLCQKLASFGVMTSSQSSLNEAGTSV